MKKTKKRRNEKTKSNKYDKHKKTKKSENKRWPHKKSITVHWNKFFNHNLFKPLFFSFINSVLYFIKKINTENRANDAVIKNNGVSIEEWIALPDNILIEDGLWSVAHQLTEYFMKEPESILVNRDQLTLDGIIQFFVQLEQYRWKFDVLFYI